MIKLNFEKAKEFLDLLLDYDGDVERHKDYTYYHYTSYRIKEEWIAASNYSSVILIPSKEFKEELPTFKFIDDLKTIFPGNICEIFIDVDKLKEEYNKLGFVDLDAIPNVFFKFRNNFYRVNYIKMLINFIDKYDVKTVKISAHDNNTIAFYLDGAYLIFAKYGANEGAESIPFPQMSIRKAMR